MFPRKIFFIKCTLQSRIKWMNFSNEKWNETEARLGVAFFSNRVTHAKTKDILNISGFSKTIRVDRRRISIKDDCHADENAMHDGFLYRTIKPPSVNCLKARGSIACDHTIMLVLLNAAIRIFASRTIWTDYSSQLSLPDVESGASAIPPYTDPFLRRARSVLLRLITAMSVFSSHFSFISHTIYPARMQIIIILRISPVFISLRRRVVPSQEWIHLLCVVSF